MKIKFGPYESDWKWIDLFPGIGIYTHGKRLALIYKNPVEFEPHPLLLASDAAILSIEYLAIIEILKNLG